MPPQLITDIQAKIPQVVEQVPYLKLLILFGSRAKGNYSTHSDWDFAVLYDEDLRQHYEKEPLDELRIWSILQTTLHLSDNQIDIVVLNKCSNILAHSIARDGQVLYEKKSGEFEQFRKMALMSPQEQKAYLAEKRAEVRATLARWKT